MIFVVVRGQTVVDELAHAVHVLLGVADVVLDVFRPLEAHHPDVHADLPPVAGELFNVLRGLESDSNISS